MHMRGRAVMVFGMRTLMMHVLRMVVEDHFMARVCPSNRAGAGDVREQQRGGREQAYA